MPVYKHIIWLELCFPYLKVAFRQPSLLNRESDDPDFEEK